jgi:S1-C subfamily serine protease
VARQPAPRLSRPPSHRHQVVCSFGSSPAEAGVARRLGAAALALVLALTPALLPPPSSAFVGVDPAPTTLLPEEERTVTLFREATPSVVFVTNLKVQRDAFTLDESRVPAGTGSGFVWDDKGHIVTNLHVVRLCSRMSPLPATQFWLPADEARLGTRVCR